MGSLPMTRYQKDLLSPLTGDKLDWLERRIARYHL